MMRPGAGFAQPRAVARIRRLGVGEKTRVVVAGPLAAADMGRLEHACAPALPQHPLPLEIDIRRVTQVDRTAAAVLDRLAQRGAHIIRNGNASTGYPPNNAA
jgi:hypothetical protein